MKRKNIDTMREVRLWIGQIVVPVVMVTATAMAIPEVRQKIVEKADKVKRAIKRKKFYTVK